MDPDKSDATQVKVNGWRQGSVIPPALANTLRAEGLLPWKLSEHELLVVISQDCDVTSPDFRIEPDVELIKASLLPKSEKHGHYYWAKNPRVYQFEASGSEGNPVIWQFRIQERVSVPRNLLLAAQPDVNYALPPEDLKKLCLWVGRRYFRVAFPDAFNDRTNDAVKTLRKTLKSKGDLLTAIYLFFVTEEELPRDEPYEVIMYGSMRLENFDVPEKRTEAQKLLDKVEAALATCTGIDVKESVLKSEADISLDELRRLKRWDFDDLTFRGEAVADLPGDS